MYQHPDVVHAWSRTGSAASATRSTTPVTPRSLVGPAAGPAERHRPASHHDHQPHRRNQTHVHRSTRPSPTSSSRTGSSDLHRVAGNTRLHREVDPSTRPASGEGRSRTASPHRCLHLLGRCDPEQVQPTGQHPGGHVAQRQATRPGAGIRRLEHRAVLVERREVRRQLVEVRAQPVRAASARPSRRRRCRSRAGAWRATRSWGRRRAPASCARTSRPLDLGPPEDRADPGVGVLQVGRRVAVERQHPVPVEHVVADPVRGQVGVLQRADADLRGRRWRAARAGGPGSSRRPRRGPARSPRR